MSVMNVFTWVFLAALAAGTVTRLWLAMRQVRHVRKHRDRVPVAFADSISLDAHRKAADYSVARVRIGVLEMLVGAVGLLALTLGGGIDWIAGAWSTVFDAGGVAHGIALIMTVLAILSLIELPLEIYRTFGTEARFGFNRMTPALFAADLGRQLLVGALLGIPLVALVLWLMQGMGERWWLYVWFAWMVFNLLMLLIYPTFIAPLFNRFTPLEDEALARRIRSLMERCGFKANGLFVMDGSKRSSHGNAYFTGFGAAKRIVFFDTLLARLAPREVEAVLAHELGHYRLRHVWKRIGLLAGFSLTMLWLLGQLIGQAWFYEGLNVSIQSTASALLLFMLTVPLFAFLLQPLASRYSRAHEFEADAYAAARVDADQLAHALVKLYQDNAATLTPDPVHSAFYDSHPPASIRIGRLARLRPTTGGSAT